MTNFHIKLVGQEDYDESVYTDTLKAWFKDRQSFNTTTQKSPEDFEDMLNDIRNEGEIIRNIFAYDVVLYKLLQVKHFDLLLDRKVRLYVNLKEVDVLEMLDAASERYCDLFAEEQITMDNIDLTLEAIEKYVGRENPHIMYVDPLNVYREIAGALSDYALDTIKLEDVKGGKNNDTNSK